LTIFRLRTLIACLASPPTPSIEGISPKNWSPKNLALVTLAGILAIAGPAADGTALRAALTSIGILGGAGFGQVLK
jgi:hypothetical protein